jgi:Collagen triple helix repeat (20 copies)
MKRGRERQRLNDAAGGIVANSAIIPAGSDGGIKVFATDSTDLVIDINGYFLNQSAMHFRGPWSFTTSYVPNDIVTFGSPASSYIALAASQGWEPDTDAASGGPHWGILAEAGMTGSQGPIGSPGQQGVPGTAGPSGLQGPTGPIGPPLSFMGTWNNSTNYAAGAAVFYNGSSYIGLMGSNVGNAPTGGAPWALLAQQGSTGATGPAGEIGPTGLTGPAGPQGTQGNIGPIGLTGPQGAVGPTGATGSIGPAGPPIAFQGTWSNATTYNTGDAVFSNGSSYISLSSANINHDPTLGAPWALLARQGATGAAGETGSAGPTGSQGIQGATGAQGAQGSIGPIGLTGAQGVAGPTGTTGPIGPAGPPISFQGTWSNLTTYNTAENGLSRSRQLRRSTRCMQIVETQIINAGLW